MDTYDRPGAAGRRPRAAAYLRCYPADPSGMECQRWALAELASAAGLSEPQLFMDNGHRVVDGLPALDALLRAVAAGWISAVLVPGLYVFGLREDEVTAAVRHLDRYGCRLLQLPSRRATARRAQPGEPMAEAA